MPDFSVVICTYNGELRLPQLLAKLRMQRAPCQAISEVTSLPNFQTAASQAATASEDSQWEVVVVDNNSRDRTAEIVRQWQADGQSATPQLWRSDIPLRYCFEPLQGLAFARRLAVRETQSPLIGFLDDDTLPDDDWVSAAIAFGQQHPEVGAYGSSISGLYEVPPPPRFHRIACCLAIIDRGDRPFCYDRERGVLPAGAGMVVRRQAWLAQVPVVPALAGVSGRSLKAKGEDVETLSYIRKTWPIWHNPQMKLAHIIPKARLEPSYLLNLFWRIGLSRYPLRKIGYSAWQWPLIAGLHFLNDFKKLLLKLLKLRQWGTVETCELSLLLGSLVSPFYHQRLPKVADLFVWKANGGSVSRFVRGRRAVSPRPRSASHLPVPEGVVEDSGIGEFESTSVGPSVSPAVVGRQPK
ncbi:MAG: hormogonium polysaccharide biosynthesis glycosyltransferase HpsE [Cyanobacteria bacterium J06606_4]